MTNIAVGRIKEHKVVIHCCKCGWHLCFYLLLQMFLLSEWGSRKFDKYGAVLKRWWWHREMSLGNIGENKSAQKEIQIKYLGKSAFPMDKNIACTAQHSYQISKTQCQDEFRNLSRCVLKILTAGRILQISIAWCQIDGEIHSFPTMYGKGGW